MRHRLSLPISHERASRNIHMVEQMAQGLLSSLPRVVEIEDLIQLGLIGLVESDHQYEGPRGGFRKYARSRVRASMLQGLPAGVYGSRRLRRTIRHLDERSQRLEQLLGRPPRAAESAIASGLTLEAYQTVLSERYLLRVDLGRAPSHLDRDMLQAAASDPMHTALELSEVRSLRKAIRNLSSRERRMLRMHYGAGIKMKAIGALFDVTESRVSQILSHALAHLRMTCLT